MKLIFAVVQDKDAFHAINVLNRVHIGVTKISSTGGFLRDGNTTLIIGVDDSRQDEVIAILKDTCAHRTQVEAISFGHDSAPPGCLIAATPIVSTETGGATVFVLNIEQFCKP